MMKGATPMSALFKAPTLPPPPTPQAPPPMPDPYNPATLEAAKAQAAARAGRSSTILTTSANRNGSPAASGVSAPYSGRSLGGA
jgi:hypothetical protein